MSSDAFLLFALPVIDLPRKTGFDKLTAYFSDAMVIVGVGLGLLVILGFAAYLWMRLRRKRRKHISGGQKVYRGSHPASSEIEDEEELAVDDDNGDGRHHHSSEASKRRYKYRVRRRTHRSRNPTLSETGGLPQVKNQEPGQPY